MFVRIKSLFLYVNFGLNQLSLSKILIFIPFIIVEILFQLLNRLSNFRLRLPCFFLCLLIKPLNVTFPTYPFSIICPFCFRSGLILYLCVFSSFFQFFKKYVSRYLFFENLKTISAKIAIMEITIPICLE